MAAQRPCDDDKRGMKVATSQRQKGQREGFDGGHRRPAIRFGQTGRKLRMARRRSDLVRAGGLVDKAMAARAQGVNGSAADGHPQRL